MDKMSVLDSEQFSLASIESDLKRLTQMAKEPRQYLDEYFNNVARQIEAECHRYVQLQTEAYTRCLEAEEDGLQFSKEELDMDIEQTELFKHSLLGEVEAFRKTCLEKDATVSDQAKVALEIVRVATEKMEKLEEAEAERMSDVAKLGEMVYEAGLKIERELFGRECFLLVLNERLNDAEPFCCLLRLVDDFIGHKGCHHFNRLLTRKNIKTHVTYEFEYYRLTRTDQDAQKFTRKRLGAEDFKVLVLSQNEHNQSLGFFDYTEIGLNAKQTENAMLSGMHLTDLDKYVFKAFRNLRDIDLSMNHLDALPEGLLSGLANLELINLSGNVMRSVPETLFKGLARLKSIDLRYNRLSEVKAGTLTGLLNLVTLNLANNQIAVLEEGTLKGLANLVTLDLNHNKMFMLDEGMFDGLRNLSALFLGKNKLTELPDDIFKDLDQLETLHLNHNRLRSLGNQAFNGLKSLASLYLQQNCIQAVQSQLEPVKSTLKLLDMSSNRLTVVGSNCFSKCHSLLGLRLVNNSIELIESDAFSGLVSLQYIDLSRNQIKELNPELFVDAIELTSISLYANSIEFFDFGVCMKALPKLERLSLHHNLLGQDDEVLAAFGVLKVEQKDSYRFFLLNNNLFVSL